MLNRAVGGIDQIEEATQRRRVLEDAHGKAGKQIEFGDQQVGKSDEGYDLTNGDLAALHEHGANRKDGDHRDGGGRPGQHGE